MAEIYEKASAEIFRALEEMANTSDILDWWSSFDSTDWPILFGLLNVAADLPRLAGNRTLETLPEGLWPELQTVTTTWQRLQELVDAPVVPPSATEASFFGPDGRAEARAELESTHCVTIDDLFDSQQKASLDSMIEAFAQERGGTWGQLERAEAPDLFSLIERGLSGPSFSSLTDFDLDRDQFTVTLSLQNLDPAGIGWHRDLYWPKEWVGEDVFAVLYGLSDDSPAKGGAFLYYVPWHNEVRAIYRCRHQATILLNHHTTEGRILHAVSRYLESDTSRHLIILQCLRRRR